MELSIVLGLSFFSILFFVVVYLELNGLEKYYLHLLVLTFVVPLKLSLGVVDIYTFDFPLAGIFLRRLLLGGGVRLRKSDLIFFSFCFVLFLSSLLSKFPLASFFDSFAFVRALCVYYVFRNISVDVLRSLAKLVVALALLEALIAFVQYLTGSYIGSPASMLGAEEVLRFVGEEDSGMFRVRGTFSYDTNLGMFYIMAITISVAIYFKTKSKALILIVFVSFLALVLTFTRTAWVSTIFSLVVMFFLLVRGGYVSGRKMVKVFSCALFAIIPVLAVFGSEVVSLIHDRIFGEVSNDTVLIRILLNEIAFDLIDENFVLGIGFGNFGPIIINEFGLSGLSNDVIKAHNFLVAILSEAGVVGLFLFVVWNFSVLIYGRAKGFYRSVFLACVLGVFLQNMAAWTILNPGVAGMFWAIFGLLDNELEAWVGKN